jgi:hypothetical protein
MSVDEARVRELLGGLVRGPGATVQAASVVAGDRLGLYKALARIGPATPAALAERTGIAERYLADWLAGQATDGCATYDPQAGRYRLTVEQAFALADDASPAFLPGVMRLRLDRGNAAGP